MKACYLPVLIASLFFPPLALVVVADMLHSKQNPSDMYRTHYPTDW